MPRYHKLYNTLMIALLAALMLSMPLVNMLLPDRQFSESENRVLQLLPEFSTKQLLNGRLIPAYESYFSDQFAFRDLWMGLKTDMQSMLGRKEINNVYLGKDGYLLQKFVKPQDELFEKNIDAINSFALENPDVNIYFMLVPTSVKVLEDKLPRFASPADQLEQIYRAKDRLDKRIRFVDVYKALASRDDQYIFYRTDHHWTTRGAFYAYSQLMGEMGLPAHSEEYFNINRVTGDFKGTLFSKSGYRHSQPDSIELYLPRSDEGCYVTSTDRPGTSGSLYNMDSLSSKDKYKVFLDGNHPMLNIHTGVNGGKLLVVKDSYANSFIPFLTGHFSEIAAADLRYYNESVSEYIGKRGIKDVLILYNASSFFEDSTVSRIAE